MAEFNTDWIAKRAYALWEEEGRPDGRHDVHWQQAADAFRALQQSADLTTANARQRIRKAQPQTSDSGPAPSEVTVPDKTRAKPVASRGRRKE